MGRPTRRRVLEQAGAAAALGATAAGSVVRPNIVFILADDLGYADLGCYGAHGIRTPALDGLAAEGVRMTQAYANSAVCSATRTALITGRYQDRLPVGLEEPVPGYSPTLGLPPSQPTLPSQLRAAGYQTWLVGKWHLGAPPAFGPLKSGYDRFFGFHYGAADYFGHQSVKPGARPEPYDGLFDGDRPVERDGYLTDILAAEAQARVRERRRDRPFLLSLHFNAPHWPWEGPRDREHSAHLSTLRDYDGGSLAKYAEMIGALDAAVGRLMQTLEAEGVARDTVVVFTSDNGGERFAEVWPFVGMKGELLEGGIRVPAIVRWPARLPAGAMCDQTAASKDWLPTFLAMAGAAPDPASPPDGVDLGPQLAGAPPRPRRLFWRYKAQEQAAVRDGDLKYLRLAGREHLFDLAADVHERADLRERRPDDFARLKTAWSEWNASMLPYPANSFSETPKGKLVDRY